MSSAGRGGGGQRGCADTSGFLRFGQGLPAVGQAPPSTQGHPPCSGPPPRTSIPSTTLSSPPSPFLVVAVQLSPAFL